MNSILTIIYLLIAYVVSRVIATALEGKIFQSGYAAIYFSIGVAMSIYALLPMFGLDLWSFSRARNIEGDAVDAVGASIFVLLTGIVVSCIVEMRYRKKRK